MDNKQEESVEKGQEINANFRKQRDPDSDEALSEDITDPEIYRSNKVKPDDHSNLEWPAREYTNRDRPSREKKERHH